MPSATPIRACCLRRTPRRRQAADPGVEAARARRRPGQCERAARPRAGLHQGPPVDRGQQPSDPSRLRRRHPQRDIVNDDELLAEHTCARAEPGMTVDSEAIFALAAHSDSDASAFEALHGSMAAAWLDERHRGVLHLARGVGRPLWLGEWQDGIVLRLDAVRARVLSALLRADASQAEGRRRDAARLPPRPGRSQASLPGSRLARDRRAACRRRRP